MTPASARFAKELIEYNSQQILSMDMGLVSSNAEPDRSVVKGLGTEQIDEPTVIVPISRSSKPIVVVELEPDDNLGLSM